MDTLIPITITTNEVVLDNGNIIRVPTWPKDQYTKAYLLKAVLEACPNPRKLYYVDLGAEHGACALH